MVPVADYSIYGIRGDCMCYQGGYMANYTLPWWVWAIVGAVIVASVVLVIVLKHRTKSGETR